MSKIKVGDTVWSSHKVACIDSTGDVMITDSGNDLSEAWSPCGPIIPDVPGLAALAAVVAEVGADNLRRHLLDAESVSPRSWNNTRRILTSLASALEVKSVDAITTALADAEAGR